MTERLTKRLADGKIMRTGIADSPLTARAAISLWVKCATIKLAAYEDTNLTPGKITQMQAELQKYRQAEAEGRLVVLSPYAKEGEPKPSCFYTDLVGAPWCLGLANENDDYPISNCQKCWYSEYSASEREEAVLAKEGGGE